MILALLFACTTAATDSADSAEETVAPPLVDWLSPAEGDTVASGTDLPCSIVVDAFTLQDPAKHNEGAPIGHVRVSVDGTEALQTGGTTFTLNLTPGAHTLEAALFFADGDEVSANADRLCDEDDSDTTCAPVSASISVTATE